MHLEHFRLQENAFGMKSYKGLTRFCRSSGRPPSTSVRLLPSLPGQMKDDFQHVEELTEGIPRKQNPTVVGMLGDQISLSQFLLRYQHLTALIRLHGGKTFPFLVLLPAVLAPNPSQGWDASPQPQRALLGMRSLVQDRFPADN